MFLFAPNTPTKFYWISILKYYTGKNPTYVQAKIKIFVHKTVYGVKASFWILFALSSKMENKEYYHGGFQHYNKSLNV